MTNQIVRVTPSEAYFSLTWKLTSRCNYDCMYCPTKWHNTDGPSHDLNTLKLAWNSILNKTQQLGLPYKISFSGGEVTTNKNFLPFIKWLKTSYSNNIFSILLTTNGSASTGYYSKLFQYVDNISFSLHSEHVDEKKFFDTVRHLRVTIADDKFLHVNIMDELWNQERIPMYIKILKEHGISHSVNEIDYKLQTRNIPIFKGDLNLDI